MLFLASILILALVILEDWLLSFSAEFYDTLAYLFDVTDEIIVHPMHHIVVKVRPETHILPSMINLGPC